VKRRRQIPRAIRRYHESLEYRLCEMLSRHAGERGVDEGAEDTLGRIIYERNRAFELLALDRLKGM
jgi:hypothetical protein